MEKVEIKSALKVAMLISSEGTTQISLRKKKRKKTPFFILISKTGNLYMQKNEPWVEANKASGRSIVSLFVLVNIIRFISAIFEPFVPTLSAKINLILGMETRTPQDERILEFLTNQSDPITGLLSLVPAGQVLNNPLPIFKRSTSLISHFLLFHRQPRKTIRNLNTISLNLSKLNNSRRCRNRFFKNKICWQEGLKNKKIFQSFRNTANKIYILRNNLSRLLNQIFSFFSLSL